MSRKSNANVRGKYTLEFKVEAVTLPPKNVLHSLWIDSGNGGM